jgi:AcrR family transcriptional regulator
MAEVDVARGRPRSERARVAVLEAAAALVRETGFAGLTIEAIASRAGVGKPTIYRRWPSKTAVVADAILEGHLALGPIPMPDTGDLVADLRAWLTSSSHALEVPGAVEIVRALTAANAEEALAARLHTFTTAPYAEALATRLRAAAGLDDARVGVLVETLLGALFFRTSSRQPITAQWIDVLVDVVVHGVDPAASR